MTQWHRVAASGDLQPGTSVEAAVAGRIVAIYNVAGTLYAMDGICPHAGGPLGEGSLQGCIVTCPWHGWQFDVTTGRHALNPRIEQATFPVKVEGADVYVQVPLPSASSTPERPE